MYFYRPNNFGTKMTEMIRLYIYSIEISHTYGRSRQLNFAGSKFVYDTFQ